MPDHDDRPQPDEDSTAAGFPPDRASEWIGPYKILEKIAEGGMGIVYLAEQQAPLRRQVALKVIKPGMDSKQVLARFEAERQALAVMDHPNVAKVFDAGTTPEGRPYFVMEYVKGVPITEYCDLHRLATRERAELFTHVCQGIQHAHQKAIIHRDIKPSNVLVSIEDERATPKIIDFGVAKATAQPLTEQTLFTALGVLIGTLEYMSPEQADLTANDIDTRADVYSLGVLLFELLVGALPFDSKELRQAGIDEIRRRIREDQPSKPSARLITLGDRAAATARCRRTDVRSLGRQLRGELDWITVKAMDKDRARRYASASELAADVRRYLDHEQISAGPPSMVYRAAKFVRKYRVALTVGGSLGVALAASLGGVAYVIRERDYTRQAYRADRVQVWIDGFREWRWNQRLLFYETLFRVSPEAQLGSAETTIDVLDRRRAQLLGRTSAAAPKLPPALRAEQTAWELNALGRLYLAQGRLSDAEPLLTRSLDVLLEVYRPKYFMLAENYRSLAELYEAKGQGERSRAMRSMYEEASAANIASRRVGYALDLGDPRLSRLVLALQEFDYQFPPAPAEPTDKAGR